MKKLTMLEKEEQMQFVLNMDARVVTKEEIEEIKGYICVEKVTFSMNVRERVEGDMVGTDQGQHQELAAYHAVLVDGRESFPYTKIEGEE